MNNRGKSLSKLELLKNRLIYLSTLLPQNNEAQRLRLRNDINGCWKTIYEYLGRNKEAVLDDDEFLRNHVFMYFKFLDETADEYSDYLLKEYFTASNVMGEKITLSDIYQYIESLQHGIIRWYNIKFPDESIGNPIGMSDVNNEVKDWLRKINRLEFIAFYPAIMAALLLIHERNENEVISFLKAIERYTFVVFKISDRKTGTGKNKIYRHASELYNIHRKVQDKQTVSIREFTDIINDMVNGSSGYSEQEFQTQIQKLYGDEKQGFYDWDGLEYLLYEYEMNLRDNQDNKIEWSRIRKKDTIEHILPQTINNNNQCWKDVIAKYNEKERKYLTHSLGNLLLLNQAKNSLLSNRCFEEKKSLTRTNGDDNVVEIGYRNGSFSEIEVAQYDTWTAKKILERGIQLLEFIEKRWNIRFTKDKKDLLQLGFVEVE
jgi:hypothetical protein